MKRTNVNIFRAVGVLQIVLLVLWVISYPLHLAFDFSDTKHSAASHCGSCEASCCEKPSFSQSCHYDFSLGEVSPGSTCNICDFALQLASSSLSSVFSIRVVETSVLRQLVCVERPKTIDFLLYYSRGPPPEMIG
jgi:hypothetical protein